MTDFDMFCAGYLDRQARASIAPTKSAYLAGFRFGSVNHGATEEDLKNGYDAWVAAGSIEA